MEYQHVLCTQYSINYDNPVYTPWDTRLTQFNCQPQKMPTKVYRIPIRVCQAYAINIVLVKLIKKDAPLTGANGIQLVTTILC